MTVKIINKLLGFGLVVAGLSVVAGCNAVPGTMDGTRTEVQTVVAPAPEPTYVPAHHYRHATVVHRGTTVHHKRYKKGVYKKSTGTKHITDNGMNSDTNKDMNSSNSSSDLNSDMNKSTSSSDNTSQTTTTTTQDSSSM